MSKPKIVASSPAMIIQALKANGIELFGQSSNPDNSKRLEFNNESIVNWWPSSGAVSVVGKEQDSIRNYLAKRLPTMMADLPRVLSQCAGELEIQPTPVPGSKPSRYQLRMKLELVELPTTA